jgi:hypothetical protein
MQRPLIKAHLLKRTIKKQNLLRSNPIGVVVFRVYDEDFELEFDDDIYIGYKRPELVKIQKSDFDDLSDYVKFRLWLARQLALKKYNEKWA